MSRVGNANLLAAARAAGEVGRGRLAHAIARVLAHDPEAAAAVCRAFGVYADGTQEEDEASILSAVPGEFVPCLEVLLRPTRNVFYQKSHDWRHALAVAAGLMVGQWYARGGAPAPSAPPDPEPVDLAPYRPTPAAPQSWVLALVVHSNRLDGVAPGGRVTAARALELLDHAVYFRATLPAAADAAERALDRKGAFAPDEFQDVYVRLEIDRRADLSRTKLKKNIRALLEQVGAAAEVRITQVSRIDDLGGLKDFERV